MLRHKNTKQVCFLIVAFTLMLTLVLMYTYSNRNESVQTEMAYEQTLFSTDTVHTLDIIVGDADWQAMLDDASSKEYIPVDIVLDGNTIKNVAIRTKGNSSLSTLEMSDSERYSFKIEFDHYQDGLTYDGLDKLALNNIIQDNTYLKDYVSYQLMSDFGADAPLCSFIDITVNGEDWGLYLAVEGIEEAFAERNYGSSYGQIYKPDSMDMVGGMGERGGDGEHPEMPFGEGEQSGEENPGMPFDASAEGEGDGFGMPFGGNADMEERGGMGMFGGSNDVALVYSDDEYDSYANIFDNAVFDITNSDKDRLIASIKQLNEGENLDEVVNIEEVLRYFVVHNFVLNFDSYTGSMMHNYYLYEDDGQLSMIAWDYNLAFGAFAMGGGMPGQQSEETSASQVDSTTSVINYPIDDPVSGATLEDRPMLGQLLANEDYLAQYHALFSEFITDYFENGEFERIVDNAINLISPYVEKDPTAFCTYEEFTEAASTLKDFCNLRAESVQKQLDGTIPATSDGQAEDSSNFVDASHIDIEVMGSQNGFGGGAGAPSFGSDFDRQMPFGERDGGVNAPDAISPEETSATADFASSALAQDASAVPSGAEATAAQDQGIQMPTRGDFSTARTQTGADASTQYWYLGICVACLTFGILFCRKIKGKR